jgi:hypothetical protein
LTAWVKRETVAGLLQRTKAAAEGVLHAATQ